MFLACVCVRLYIVHIKRDIPFRTKHRYTGANNDSICSHSLSEYVRIMLINSGDETLVHAEV